MIISHHHHFVFVKTNKTAGSSFEILLSNVLGPHDIATKLSEAEETLRSHLTYQQLWQSPRRLNGVRQHSSYQKAILAHPKCLEYFSFGFTRNPFERLVSSFRWKMAPFIRVHIENARENPNIYKSEASPVLQKLKSYVLGRRHKLNVRGINLLNTGEHKVGVIYKYEEMAQAVNDISQRIGADLDIKLLPRLKANTPKIPSDWILWDDQLISTINAVFAWEFDHIGYSRIP
jgi:hypothetical protein